jgi:pyridoxamine 5'-phosphate oxidase
MAHRPVDPVIANLRRDYMQRGLSRRDLDPDPIRQFSGWFQEALDSKVILEPNAMVLSTVSDEGAPRGRFVLLKGFDALGFLFFTNYQSTKGHHLQGNPKASLTFGWLEMERQVCIEGRTERTPRQAVETYFETRPRGSRLGAWASPQSEVVSGRAALEANLTEAKDQFAEDVPPPPHWGGYRLVPEKIEFWQGRTNRLHDRFRYQRQGEGWAIDRLAP